MFFCILSLRYLRIVDDVVSNICNIILVWFLINYIIYFFLKHIKINI